MDKCSVCGKDGIAPNWVKEKMAANPELKYICGYCNAERALRNMSETFDRVFNNGK